MIRDYHQYVQMREREEATAAAQLIQDAVTEALYPFKPGCVTTCFTQDRLDMAYKIQVSADNLVDDNLVFYPDVSRTYYTSQIAKLIARKAFDHYRNLPRITPGENIVLGDD